MGFKYSNDREITSKSDVPSGASLFFRIAEKKNRLVIGRISISLERGGLSDNEGPEPDLIYPQNADLSERNVF